MDGWRGFLGGWSPDGSRLGYGAFGGEDKGLWELPFIIVGKPVLLPPHRILSGSCTLPSWPPDGSKMVFDFRSPERGYEVWMVDSPRLSAAGRSATSEGTRPNVRVYQLRYAKAQEVVERIRQRIPLVGRLMSVGVDTRMNAILVSGDEETLKFVERLLERLDVAQQEPVTPAITPEGPEGSEALRLTSTNT